MDLKHRRILTENLDILIQETKNDINNIVNEFRQRLVINDFMVNKINKHASNEGKAKELWQMLPKRGPDAFHKIQNVLSTTGNGEVLKFVLRPTHVMLKEESKAENKNGFIDEPNSYQMLSKPRGRVLIVNVYSYLPYQRDETREGSEVDVENLKNLYERLGHEVEIISQPTGKKFKEGLRKFLKTKEPCADCCTIFIMTHGKADREFSEVVNLRLYDGMTVSSQWIIEQLRTSEAPAFAGVPKIIFFVTCRGLVADPGICIKDDFINKITSVPQTDGFVQNCPLLSDVLVVYSTSQGNLSYRDEQGAWLIQELVDVMEREAGQSDLLTILEEVDRQLRIRGTLQRTLQISAILKIGFNRKLYFNPPSTFTPKKALTNGNK